MATAIAACARLGWRARYIGASAPTISARCRATALTAKASTSRASRTVAGGDESVCGHPRRCANRRADGPVGSPSGAEHGAGRRPRDAVTSGRLLIVDCHQTAAAAQAARYARAAGIPTIIDVEKVRPGIGDLLQNIDVIIAAEEFPGALTGHEDLGTRARQHRARRRRVDRLRRRSAPRAASPGATAAKSARRRFQVDCVDSTGAGDCFRGAFAAACLQHAQRRRRGRADFCQRRRGAELPRAGVARRAAHGGRGRPADAGAAAHVTFIHTLGLIGVYARDGIIPDVVYSGNMAPRGRGRDNPMGDPDAGLAALDERALVEACLAGQSGAFDLHRRAPSPLRVSALLPVRRQPRGRERSVAGRVPARLSRAAQFPRPVVARDVAVSDRRQRVPESRQRESAARPSRSSSGSSSTPRGIAVRAPAARRARARGCGRPSRSCRASSVRRSILRIYHEMSHQEIADVLGSSVGAVKANFFHALGSLKKLLGDEFV